jgi:hypothetical protein
MRKLLFIASIVVGAFAGLLFSIDDDWATQIVMGGVGALVGIAIGGAFTGRGNGSRRRLHVDEDKTNTWVDDLPENFWRDRGHPPFMKPWDALPDRHMLDPDKVE